jgi:hypothetical protein
LLGFYYILSPQPPFGNGSQLGERASSGRAILLNYIQMSVEPDDEGGNDRGISGRCEGGDRAIIQAKPSKLESTLFKLVKTTS